MGDISHMASTGVEAPRSRCYRPGSGIWLAVGWLGTTLGVHGASRPGRVGHSDPQRPSTGSIWRRISKFTHKRAFGIWYCHGLAFLFTWVVPF
jgi:hypothetical protein